MSAAKPTIAASIGELAKKAAEITGSDIYLYNGPIRDSGFVKILSAVAKEKHSDSAILLITTYGGDARAAYRIARWFQTYYSTFILFPTSLCMSAGTLLAMGAHRLYMSPFSELGPLDVQLIKRNELGEQKSGLVTKAALEKLQSSAFEFWEHFMLHIKTKSFGNVSFEKCADIASQVCGRAFAEMYRQIDPNILGEDDRDMQVAEQYGKRLAAKGQNIDEESIKSLVNDYPSHDFVIDFDEASELFEDVALPPSELMQLMLALGKKAMLTQSETGGLVVERLATAPKIETKTETAPETKSEDEANATSKTQDDAPKAA